MNDLSTTPGARTGVADDKAEARAILAGLSADPPTIAPKYFYDRLGSALFAAICETPEYYPTRIEAAILPDAARATRERLGERTTLVDLGAGDCRKAGRLLPILGSARYVGIDISIDFLRDAVGALGARYPGLAVAALERDLGGDWSLAAADAPGRRLLFYPGSSIGNYTPAEAVDFLRRARAQAGDDGALLIGVDLVKDRAILEAAYDDSLGITAAFNRNALLNLNRIVGTDFDPSRWRHVARFDAGHSRIEMHLEASDEQRVAWPGGERRFRTGERIHTESSYKYQPDDFAALLGGAGWRVADRWFDPKRWFAVFLADAD